MRKGAKVNLEMALMADGVPAAEVYETLATPEGMDRAFAKLDTIKDHVVWWEAGAQPPQLLADGEVAMTTAYNGRIFGAAVGEGKPFEIVWDGQVYELEGYVIPKGAPNLEAAIEFINFATGTEPLANAAEWISYGPPRKSSRPAGRHVPGRQDRDGAEPADLRGQPHERAALVLRVLGRPRHRTERALQRLARRQLRTNNIVRGRSVAPGPLSGAIMAQAALSGREPRAVLSTADGTPLRAALARASRRARWKALALVLPLLLFVLMTFVVPIGQMLYRSVANPAFSDAHADRLSRGSRPTRPAPHPTRPPLPRWSRTCGRPRSSARSASSARASTTRSRARARCSPPPARRAGDLEPPFREAMLALDADWAKPELWAAMRGAAARHTPNFYIAALDRKLATDGGIVRVRARAAHLPAAVLAHDVALGGHRRPLPAAGLPDRAPARHAAAAHSNLLMILVLLPFWTSLLVRTTSWMVLLQRQGVINDVLVWLGVISTTAASR